MWARRRRYLGISDTLRVPAAVTLALQGRGPPHWPPPPCPVSEFVLYQLGEEVTVVLSNPDCPAAIEMYVTSRAAGDVLRAAAHKTVSSFFLDDEPLCGQGQGQLCGEGEAACLQVFDAAGDHMLTAIRALAPAEDEGALGLVDVCVCVRASEDGTRFEHVSTTRKPRRVVVE